MSPGGKLKDALTFPAGVEFLRLATRLGCSRSSGCSSGALGPRPKTTPTSSALGGSPNSTDPASPSALSSNEDGLDTDETGTVSVQVSSPSCPLSITYGFTSP